MSEQALLLEAHHTTHIEGTRLTLAEAEQLMAGQPVPQADDDDVRELLNYRDAFSLVSDYLDSGAPITEGLIREIHKRLVSGVRGDRAQPGEYRLVQNFVANAITGDIIYTPPPPADVPKLMRDLVEWLSEPGAVHPVLASGVAKFQLVHIHYLLEPRPYDDKSKYLLQGGFAQMHAAQLEEAIRNQVADTEAINESRNEYGISYRVEGDLIGVNGLKLPVRTIWLQRHSDSSVHFITLVPLKAR